MCIRDSHAIPDEMLLQDQVQDGLASRVALAQAYRQWSAKAEACLAGGGADARARRAESGRASWPKFTVGPPTPKIPPAHSYHADFLV
eukprot:6697810-Alexandrium_andersonii.AAC.1